MASTPPDCSRNLENEGGPGYGSHVKYVGSNVDVSRGKAVSAAAGTILRSFPKAHYSGHTLVDVRLASAPVLLLFPYSNREIGRGRPHGTCSHAHLSLAPALRLEVCP